MTTTLTIDSILESLRGGSTTTDVLAEVRRMGERGEARELVALWRALAEREPNPALDGVANEIEESLALGKGDAPLQAVLELASEPRRTAKGTLEPRDRAPALASRLGFARTKNDLFAALDRRTERTFELFACWFEELVLRGAKLKDDPAAIAFDDELARREHPLARMPLTLYASEREAPSYMPLYGAGAIDSAVARLESGPTSARTIPPPAEHQAPKATLIEDAALEKRLLRAVEPWLEESNGRAEARVFALAPKIETSLVGRWLVRALPLESTRGAGAELDIKRVQAEVVWGTLFAAAANGGAYSPGLGGAHGRRAAWDAFGALVGAEPGATIEAIDDAAVRCSFLAFGGSAWFEDVAWDLGVLALRPDGASVAVLAATDTD